MLNNTLKRMGLYASKTVGDGNCMFRALSDQVWGNDNRHLGLRQEVSTNRVGCMGMEQGLIWVCG